MSLVLSALLSATALRSPDQHWLAWVSFLPLFVVVRCFRPRAAVVAGGFWGGCLYLFCSAGSTPAIDTVARAVGPSVWLFALLIVIPAVYVGLASRPTRAIGFKLLTLALGWTLIEVVLAVALTNPSGNTQTPTPPGSGRVRHADLDSGRVRRADHEGSGRVRRADHPGFAPPPYQERSARRTLLGSQGDGLHFHSLTRLLGYVSTAFLVACVNASLVGVVSGARLRFPRCTLWPGSPNAVGWFPSQVVVSMQSWALRQAHPRAPPS